MSLFINRFCELTKKSGKMQKDICTDLGIKEQKFTKWKTGYTEPHLDDIIILADYFGVTTDYLLGYTNADGSKNPLTTTETIKFKLLVQNLRLILL